MLVFILCRNEAKYEERHLWLELKPVRQRVVEDAHDCRLYLKLTGTDKRAGRRAGGRAGRRAQVSIGRPAPPKNISLFIVV